MYWVRTSTEERESTAKCKWPFNYRWFSPHKVDRCGGAQAKAWECAGNDIKVCGRTM